MRVVVILACSPPFLHLGDIRPIIQRIGGCRVSAGISHLNRGMMEVAPDEKILARAGIF